MGRRLPQQPELTELQVISGLRHLGPVLTPGLTVLPPFGGGRDWYPFGKPPSS